MGLEIFVANLRSLLIAQGDGGDDRDNPSKFVVRLVRSLPMSTSRAPYSIGLGNALGICDEFFFSFLIQSKHVLIQLCQ